MLFGNWKVTEDSIAWTANKLQPFVIPVNELTKTIVENEGKDVYYDWILSATAQDWLTQNDLYDLNYAFVYAVAKFGLDFNYQVFDATVAEQYEIFDIEDAEDLDLE